MDRLTEKTIGCFEYDLKDHEHVIGEFSTYDAFYAYSMAVKRLGQYEETGLTPEEIKSLYHDAGLGIAISNRDLRAENQRLKAVVEAAERCIKAERDGVMTNEYYREYKAALQAYEGVAGK